ncbi:CYTH and CHAD domain-containing protein [Actinomadura sp. NEAU-AAG7]|uniref:CYTH and CHAD domain-containing protein n=1 Tax=Actinomadura sp. NEAU-AAG7 TaxID=2839640 RepID=UPI001BE4064C|nr:CYTH and CHAD domain-containing protein [Actinomadura sp. NEAU-AAG7]MBT2211884.1 CYTH and CHAD domain-containing protein [Actinomadura sp. NEAU-AAG7]
MTAHVEVERKYKVGGGYSLPDLREVTGLSTAAEPRTLTLTARYYDTADLRLARRGITLRRRTGGTDDGWHLKLPRAKGGRDEIQAPAGEAASPPPAELAGLLLAHTRGLPLVAVAEIRTDRTERELLDRGGTVLAQLVDDRVTGVRLEPREEGVVTWRELEVELVDGEEDVLDAVGEHLTGSGAQASQESNKLSIVLGVAPAPDGYSGEMRSTVQVMSAYLSAQAARMLAYDPRVRLADHDDDSVHKMRTSIRRFRSILRTHRTILDRPRVKPLDAELKWLSDALGEVRDLEVLQARFRAQLAGLPGGRSEPGWLLDMRHQELQARERLRGVLRSQRYLALLDRIDAMVTDPPVRRKAHKAARKQQRKIVARARRKMTDAYREAGKAPRGEDRDAALHKTRKAAKRLRHTAEAAKPVLGKRAAKIARRAEKLQDVLGDNQDRIVAAGRLERMAPEPGGASDASDAYALGALTTLQRYDDPLTDLPSTWRKAADPKLVKRL